MFQKQDRIYTHGLSSKSHNGLYGMVLSDLQENDRYHVRLEHADGSKSTAKIRTKNLKPCSTPADQEAILVAESPPAKWWDEDLGDHAADGPDPSAIHRDEYKEILTDLYTGTDSSDAPVVKEDGFLRIQYGWKREGGQPHSGITLLMVAAVSCDLPLIKAVLRSGADVNFECGTGDGGTALKVLVTQECLNLAPLQPGRSKMGAIAFLLEIGADPSLSGTAGTPTPVEVALGSERIDLVEVLLRAPLGDRVMAQVSMFASRCRKGKLRRAFLRLAKSIEADLAVKGWPVALCQCTSGRPRDECHFSKKGAPVHPKQPCPCKRNQDRTRWAQGHSVKPYEKCCFKNRFFQRENFYGKEGHGQYIVDLSWQVRGVSVKALEYTLSQRTQELMATGMSEQEAKEKMKNEPFLGGGGDSRWEEMNRQFNEDFVPPFVAAGCCDPAYAYACSKSDFMHARPWRTCERRLDKGEMELRAQEWNALVDEYTATRPPVKGLRGPNTRPVLQIEQAAKISCTGGALHAGCGNPQCARVEPAPGSFKTCSACKLAKFCSAECMKAAWKPVHKAQCGSLECEPRLPSEKSLTAKIDHFTGIVTKKMAASD